MGAVSGSREWTPFGVEVGTARGGLGYTGEWFDNSTKMAYLRARWYDGTTGRFTRKDPFSGILTWPQSQNPYPYAANNPVLRVDPSGRFCVPCAIAIFIGLAFVSGCATDDYDCSDVEIALASTDVECKGLECSKHMVAAFWLPRGNQTTFRNKCAVIQWVRGSVYDNGELVTCSGDDCQKWPSSDGSERIIKMCPPRGNCQTISSLDWHVDQLHSSIGPEYPLFDSTDAGGMAWDRLGFRLPDGVPDDGRAIYMRDTPTIGAEEPGHELKIDMEFAIAVYNRDDLGNLPAHGGDWGSPDESPLPCVQKRWYFYKESYTTTQPD